MLKLFQSIFSGGNDEGRYPESLVEATIERAVDGTDPRLRALPGYRKQLRAPVGHAIDHVMALVDHLPAPLAADRGVYSREPCLRVLFASADRMLEVFGHDNVLNEFRRHTGDSGPVTALLLAALHADEGTLQAYLDMTADLLMDAKQQLWVEVIDLRLDRMNIRRDTQDPSAKHVQFQELHNARGRRLVMLFVSLALGELPRRENFFTAAERYLR